MESHTRHLSPSVSKSSFFVLLTICGVFPLSAFTISGPDREITRGIINYIINNQYDSAFIVIDGQKGRDDEPLLLLLKLATQSMRDVDFEKTVDSSLFLATYDQTIATVEKWEKQHGVSSQSKMLFGMCRAIHSAFYLRQKKYLSALQNGLDAINQLREAQEIDSTNYDVDLFLGLYEYGRAELRSRFWWVLFWYPGNRQTGIGRVLRCAENAIITAEAAQLSLCDLYLKEKLFNESKNQIDHLKSRYPQSRFVLWAEVKYFETRENYSAAASVYSQLSQSYSREKLGEYNHLYTKNRQAFMLYKAGDMKSAKKLCDNILVSSAIGKYRELRRETNKLSERCHAADD